MEIVEASITAQEKVVLVEVKDAKDQRCLTQFAPSVAPIAKFLLSQMAEKKFSVVSVLVR